MIRIDIRGDEKVLKMLKQIGGRIPTGSVTTFTTLPYAPYVEYGTNPHTISAVRKKALMYTPTGAKMIVRKGKARAQFQTFMGYRTTDMSFAKSVKHPGTKPHPFMRPGAYDSLYDIKLALIDNMVGMASNRSAFSEIGAIVTNRQKEYCPVGYGGGRTHGALRRDIKYRASNGVGGGE